MGLNRDERAKITQFTDEIYDENKPPKVRLATAFELLELDAKLLGRVTARTERACRSLISKFKNYSAAVLRTQKEIRAETQRLSEALQAAVALRPASGAADEDSPDPVGAPAAAAPVPDIPGIELLPPDGPDKFWDATEAGRRRRDILGLSLGMRAFMPYTRADVIAKHSPIERIVPGTVDPPYSHTWMVRVIRVGARDWSLASL